MQIAICDDEKEAAEMLADKIREFYPEASLSLYQSGDELLLSGSCPDILFLDIRMEGKNGIETAREFRKVHRSPILIFVTAMEEYVFQAFDVGAFHYLVKPFNDVKFAEVLKNAVQQLADQKKQNDGFKRESANLIVTAEGKHIAVDMKKIVYAEVFNRKIILHTVSEDIEYYGRMKELEKLAGEDFYRTHRAYLVNFKYIIKYDSRTIWLERGHALMAKRNYGGFVKSYLRYNQRKGRKAE